MKVLSIILLVFAVYFNVLLFYRLFSNKNNKININAVVTSVRGIIVTYSYEYNGKTYIKSEEATKIVKVGDLYPIIIDKNGEISTALPDLIENILMTILVFLSILFYGLSYYANRN
jgi:hypothetical protein